MLKSLNSMSTDTYEVRTEKINSLAIKSFQKEKEIAKKEIKIENKKEIKAKEPVVKTAPKKKEAPKAVKEVKPSTKSEDVNFSFKKALTTREQLVFDHFLENKNTIVYAKDLAKILDLPRDYVYKYIKNLRSKLNEDILQNADNGGYLLKV